MLWFHQILNRRRASKDFLWHAENQRTFQTLGNNIHIECNILPWFTTYIKKLMSSLSLIWLNKSSLVKKQAIKNLPSLQQNISKGTICCIYRLLVSFNTRLFWPKKSLTSHHVASLDIGTCSQDETEQKDFPLFIKIICGHKW